MQNIIKSKIYPELFQAVKNDDIVLFVGAGTSWELNNIKSQKLEGWKNLVIQLLHFLVVKGYDVSSLLNIVNEYDPILILRLLEKKEIPENDFMEFVSEFYTISDENDFSLHKKLYTLSPRIITTNYDRAFEFAIPQIRKSVAHSKKKYELSKVIYSKEFLFKLHGCAENGDSMVIFPDDYDKLYNEDSTDSKDVLHRLEHLISNKTILFIGCGLGDFQINSIFLKIRDIVHQYSKSHFILSKSKISEKLDFVKTIEIEQYKDIELILDELISHKSAVNTFSKDELDYSINKARKSLENVEEEISEYGDDDNIERIQSKLLKRVALEEFTKGAKLHEKKKFAKAIEHYKASSEYDRSNEFTFIHWGSALAEIGKKNNKKSYILESISKYKNAIKINSSSYRAYNNWGASLLFLGYIILKDDTFINDSINKFKKALSFKHNYSYALCNLGLAYFKLGELNKNIDIIRDSLKYFRNAEISDSRFSSIYINWGSALYSIGEYETNDEYLFKAIKIFKKSIELNPTCEKSYYNLGNSYFLLSKFSNNNEHSELAYDYFKLAKSLGHHCFNLSCWYAYNSQLIESIDVLKNCLKKKVITLEIIESMQDLEILKELVEYQELIKRIER